MSWWIVTQDYPPASTGGVASWASDLAAALHAYGESVRILARAAGDTAQEDGAGRGQVRAVGALPGGQHALAVGD